ncbi:MAG: NAD(P)H-hydrate epimerase [Bacteroidota bacterium]
MFPLLDTYPSLTTAQMIEVDRAMIEDYQILLIQMMENAGRNLAILARERFLNGDPSSKKVIVLAGTGGNGGGAMVAARRLHNWGAEIEVFVSREPQADIPKHQFAVLQRMGISVRIAEIPKNSLKAELILDGLIGYSLKGHPRGTIRELIQWGNTQASPTLSLDTPSGIDLTSGTIYDPVIKAVATLTLALPKVGLLRDAVQPLVGELYLGDISVPPSLYASAALQIEVPNLFAQSDIVRLL